jgi:hypothetical protein
MARWIPIFATCGVLWSPTARADSTTEAPPSDSAVTAADEQRLQWILDTASSDARQGRERAAVVDAVFSAIVLPSGIILVTRSDRGLEAVGVNLIVDGGWGLLGLASTPFPSTMEKLRARHEKLGKWRQSRHRSQRDRGGAPGACLATARYLALARCREAGGRRSPSRRRHVSPSLELASSGPSPNDVWRPFRGLGHAAPYGRSPRFAPTARVVGGGMVEHLRDGQGAPGSHRSLALALRGAYTARGRGGIALRVLTTAHRRGCAHRRFRNLK